MKTLELDKFIVKVTEIRPHNNPELSDTHTIVEADIIRKDGQLVGDTKGMYNQDFIFLGNNNTHLTHHSEAVKDWFKLLGTAIQNNPDVINDET